MSMHKRYYSAQDVECLEEQALLDDESDTSDDEDGVEDFSSNKRTAKVKYLFIIPFIVFFALLYIPLFHSVTRHRSVALAGWWSNVSREVGLYVLPDRTTTIINNSVCDSNANNSNNEKILILVVVCSAVENFDERDSIRETWGNVSSFNYPMFKQMHGRLRGSYLQGIRNFSEYSTGDAGKNLTEQSFAVKIIFLIGQTKQAFNTEFPDELQEKIADEAEMYDDILQEGFLDTYNNLTLKSVMLLKWVTHHCEDKVKFILKVDDDAFINLPNLMHVLLGGTIPVYSAAIGFHDRESILVRKSKNRLAITKNLLLGHLFCGVKPVADVASKWYTPYYLYQGDTYPGYLSGTAYLMSFSAAAALYNVSLATPYFHLEDVYTTGICATKINLVRTHHPLFFYSTVRDRDKHFCALRGMISQHQLSPSDMKIAYDAITNVSMKCPVPGKKFLTSKLKLQAKKKCLKK